MTIVNDPLPAGTNHRFLGKYSQGAPCERASHARVRRPETRPRRTDRTAYQALALREKQNSGAARRSPLLPAQSDKRTPQRLRKLSRGRQRTLLARCNDTGLVAADRSEQTARAPLNGTSGGVTRLSGVEGVAAADPPAVVQFVVQS